ncbi:MAG TPA: CHAD domain-containing protein, partial [Methylocella sp.]|nr:CHAD domain-containing protein [Methylocella sp.]
MAAEPEVELKFLVAERDIAKVESLLAAAAPGRERSMQRLRAVYFDTPKHDLWKRGFILRVRTANGGYVQTVKRPASSSIKREEWEDKVTGPEPDVKRLKNTPLAGLARKPAFAASLRPVFEVNVDRTLYNVETQSGQIEAALDQGSIFANGAALGVSELELELKKGQPCGMYDLARRFVSQAPLFLNPISKAERGYLLGCGAWGRPAKGSRPQLRKDMTSREAFQEICRACLHDFHLNAADLESCEDIEAVHQSRMAIRRLRAAMALFKPLVFDPSYRRFQGELRWLAGLLGAARDLDVLQENLPRLSFKEGGAGGKASPAAAITGGCEAERHQARQAIVEALESERGRAFLLDFALWVEDGRWQALAAPAAKTPIAKFARAQLKKRLTKLTRKGADLEKLSPPARHEIRIEAKKLRYMAEFFAGLPGVARERKDFKALINLCEKLQETLGAMRDEEAFAAYLHHQGAKTNGGWSASGKAGLLPAGEGVR